MACMYRAAAIVSGLWLLFSPALAGAAGKPAAVDAARLSAADREAGDWMSYGLGSEVTCTVPEHALP